MTNLDTVLYNVDDYCYKCEDTPLLSLGIPLLAIVLIINELRG